VDSKKSDKFLVKYVWVEEGAEGEFGELFVAGGKPEEFRLKCVLPNNYGGSNIGISNGSAEQHQSQEGSTMATNEPTEDSSVLVPAQSATPEPAKPEPTKQEPKTKQEPTIEDKIEELKAQLREAVSKNEALQRKVASLQVSSLLLFY
jgi:hypothetical protein